MSAQGADGWQRLARAVRGQRELLGLSQSEVERRGGPSVATVRNVENAYRAVSFRSLQLLDGVLGWRTGSCKDVLSGGEPHPLPIEEQRKAAIERMSTAELHDQIKIATDELVRRTLR